MDLIGYLGQDAIVRDVQGQSMKAISFSVAHSEKYKDAQGTQHERTTWVSCTLWRSADKLSISNYLVKGQKVFVSGTPSAIGYVSQKNGQAAADLRIRVESIELLGSANNNNQGVPFTNAGASQQPTQNNYTPMPSISSGKSDIQETEDDLPF